MAGEAVSIKGTKNGLVIVFDSSLDIEEIKKNLKSKMETSGGFFKGAKFTVCNLDSGTNQHYVNELEGICRQYGMIPSREVLWPPVSGKGNQVEIPAKRKNSRVIPLRQQVHAGGEQAVLVARTLRSGQTIYSPHNVVIMGDINPGAEVVSEKSIYVMGNCKGSVHAGCTGNLMSEVLALRLQPIILRIGTFSADTTAFFDPGMPLAARVIRGEIVINRHGNPGLQNTEVRSQESE
jgi:septum site-determining protein MinC